jgi:dihydroneopterin aldolase
MKGIMGFDNLKINCIVGILSAERNISQDIYIDIKVQYDLKQCLTSHSIHDTVDYIRLVEISMNEAQYKHGLLEIFAYKVLEQIYEEFSVSWAWIRIKKPQALPEAQWAFVEMEKGERQ